jgi:hypothetical protein
MCGQCWKAVVFLITWVTNTTMEFKVKIFITILLTFTTDFYKGVYEKYVEGADPWKMFMAGLDAMVRISAFFYILCANLSLLFWQ